MSDIRFGSLEDDDPLCGYECTCCRETATHALKIKPLNGRLITYLLCEEHGDMLGNDTDTHNTQDKRP